MLCASLTMAWASMCLTGLEKNPQHTICVSRADASVLYWSTSFWALTHDCSRQHLKNQKKAWLLYATRHAWKSMVALFNHSIELFLVALIVRRNVMLFSSNLRFIVAGISNKHLWAERFGAWWTKVSSSDQGGLKSY
jgi:hypothetical protein